VGTRTFRTLAALGTVALLFWAGWESLSHQHPQVGSAARGETLYVNLSCSSCHGTAGQGGGPSGGPKLVPNPFPLEALTQQMRKPRLNMPVFSEERASDQDIADIHAYLVSIKAN
jgi:mono/diheme cytochrome c family protein